MDLLLTPDEEAFREEVRDFLDTAMTDSVKESARLTAGLFSPHEGALEWQRILHKKGWAAPSWPVEHGGPGWNTMQRYIWDVECQTVGVPRLFPMGLKMVAPAIQKFGTPEQKAKYLPRILSGEDFWCQGYSEPGAGSDLASLQCKAVSDGDDYIINGTKMWTSCAHLADMIFCLVRTSSEGKKQDGISFIVFPMDTPGISVEPIITMAGDHEVNQTFFDDVRVPKANLIGRENEGWTVAKYLLEFERGGQAFSPMLFGQIRRLRGIAGAEHSGTGERLIENPGFAARLADLESLAMALEIYEKRTMSALSAGGNPGFAASAMKLRSSEILQGVSALAAEALGYYSAPYQPELLTPFNNAEPIAPDHAVGVVNKHLNNRAATIYAGSSEVQRTILAKGVLGL